jgi:hypothetical protein
MAKKTKTAKAKGPVKFAWWGIGPDLALWYADTGDGTPLANHVNDLLEHNSTQTDPALMAMTTNASLHIVETPGQRLHGLDKVLRMQLYDGTIIQLSKDTVITLKPKPRTKPAATPNDLPPGAVLSRPMSKSEMGVRAGLSGSRRKTNSFLKAHGLRQVGDNRQLFQVNMQEMDAATRAAFQKP